MSKLSIKKQFQIILGCMAALCLILSVVSYTALDRLLLKNAAAYARNTLSEIRWRNELPFSAY